MIEKEKGWVEVEFEDKPPATAGAPEEPAVAVDEPEPIKEDRDREGKRAQRRINALTKKWRTAEEILLSERAARSDLEAKLDRLMEEFDGIKKNGAVNVERAVQDKYNGAMARLKKAKEEGDYGAEAQATSDIADAHARWGRIQAEKDAAAKEPPPKASAQEAPQRTQEPQRLRERAQEWVDEHKWFGKDKLMTGVATEIARELEADGFDPDGDELYAELEKRLAEEMPNRFKGTQAKDPKEDAEDDDEGERKATKRRSVDEPVSGRRSGVAARATGGTENRLTQREAETAKRLGLSNRDYLMEKKRIANSVNGYTEIEIPGRQN